MNSSDRNNYYIQNKRAHNCVCSVLDFTLETKPCEGETNNCRMIFLCLSHGRSPTIPALGKSLLWLSQSLVYAFLAYCLLLLFMLHIIVWSLCNHVEMREPEVSILFSFPLITFITTVTIIISVCTIRSGGHFLRSTAREVVGIIEIWTYQHHVLTLN